MKWTLAACGAVCGRRKGLANRRLPGTERARELRPGGSSYVKVHMLSLTDLMLGES